MIKQLIWTIWTPMSSVLKKADRLNLSLSPLRNGMPDWHETKGMWVNWMLYLHCDFQLWPHLWPWPWIFNVKFWNNCIPGMGEPIDMERKGYESIRCYTYFVTLSCDLELWPWPWIFKVKLWKCCISGMLNSCISGMGGPIGMERKGYEWIGCYTNYVTLSYDFGLGFWWSNF